MLSLIVDRYAVTNDETLRDRAASVFQGIQRCATVHGVPGFLARGICPEDGKSIYPNSSRDQYTHAVHVFRRATRTHKSLFLTMITTFGVRKNAYAADLVASEVTMEDLF
jgi:hypothetical protein